MFLKIFAIPAFEFVLVANKKIVIYHRLLKNVFFHHTGRQKTL